MISLSDEQMDFVIQITAPLEPTDRSRFLAALAEKLKDATEIGDGELNRVSRALLASGMYWKPPDNTRQGQSNLDRKLRA